MWLRQRSSMSDVESRLPTLKQVERVLGPARLWAGRCYEVACACVAEGLVAGAAVYGHWLGPVHPRSYFGRLSTHPDFVRHGWVLLLDRRVFDPTRWTFTAERPYLHVGANEGEYDEGGNCLRETLLRPPPRFDREEGGRVYVLGDAVLSSPAWSHVEELLAEDYSGDDHSPGEVTAAQLFWLANLPYDRLEPHAGEVYSCLRKLGHEALVPVDNLRRAERECPLSARRRVAATP